MMNKGQGVMLFIVALDIIALLIFGLGNFGTPAYNNMSFVFACQGGIQGYSKYLQISLAQNRPQEAIAINLSNTGVTSFSDIQCYSTTGKRVPYQVIQNGFWNGANTSAQWSTSNYLMVYQNETFGTINCMFSNTTQKADLSTSIALWFDDFESYNTTGGIPVVMPFRNRTQVNANGGVCRTNGQQGVCINGGANHMQLNVTQYSNLTGMSIIWEINETQDVNNGMRMDTFGVNAGNYYRNPQETGIGTYCTNVAGGACVGDTVTKVLGGRGINFTSNRQGDTINFWINNTEIKANATETTTVTHSEIGFLDGTAKREALLDLKMYNLSVIPYVPTSFTLSVQDCGLVPA